MKRFFKIFVFFAAVAILGSCSHIGDMEVEQYKIRRVTPSSLRDISATVGLKVCNRGIGMTITSITGDAYRRETHIGSFSVDSLTIPAKTTQWIDVSGAVSVDPSLSLFDVIWLAENFDQDLYDVSFAVTVKLGKIKKTIKRDRMPLSKLMNAKDSKDL